MTKYVLILLVLCVFLLSVGTASAGWTQYLNDSKNSGKAGSSIKGNASVSWQYKPGGVVSSSTVVSGGNVYFGTMGERMHRNRSTISGTAVALNSSTGKLDWEVSLDAGVWSTPAHSEGALYVASLNGSLYSLNSSTGNLIWQKDLPNPIFSPLTVDDGNIYVGTRDLNAHSLSKKNDFSVYKINKSNADIVWEESVDQGMFGAVTVGDGRVYLGTQNGSLLSINSDTGETIWSFDTDNMSPTVDDPMLRFGGVASTPIISNERVYFGSYAGDVYSLDMQEGDLIWKFSTNQTDTWDTPIVASPTNSNSTIYVGDYGGKLYAINASSGIKSWALDTDDWITKSSLVMSNGRLYFGTAEPFGTGTLYSVNTTQHKPDWTVQVNGSIRSAPAVVDGNLYFSSLHNVYSINQNNSADSEVQDYVPDSNTSTDSGVYMLLRNIIENFIQNLRP